MKVSWFDVSDQGRATWEAVCPVGAYQVVKPNQVPSILPSGFTMKCDSVVVMGSAVGTVGAFYMANYHRVDVNASAIDQQPLGIVFGDQYALGSACFIHHGTWGGRTTPQSPGFSQYSAQSGTGSVYPLSELPSAPSGELSQMYVFSQRAAFAVVVDEIKSLWWPLDT